MILILTPKDLTNPDLHILSVDVRVVVAAIGQGLFEKADRVEYHALNGWIRVLKDVLLDRPPGFVPKTNKNGFGEADRINHTGTCPPDWYVTRQAPGIPAVKPPTGFTKSYPLKPRKILIDG